MDWTADVVNDPSRDYDLCVDLWEGDQHRATIFRSPEGEVRLKVYPSSDKAMEVPAHWLVEVLQRAEKDIGQDSPGDPATGSKLEA